MSQLPIKIGLPGSNRRFYDGLRNGILRDPLSGSWWWSQRLRLTDFTPAAGLSQTLVFSTLFPNNPFPQRVVRKSVLLYVAESLAGPAISNGVAEVGDTGDTDGVLDNGDIFGNDGATIQDLTAAQFAERYENDWAADGFGIVLTATGANLNVATALDLKVMVEFSPTLFVP